jgi:hypothetical protein
MGYLPRGKIREFFKSDMIGLEGALFKRWKLEGNEGSRAHLKGGRIENALPLMVEGSKEHSKRNEVRARRRTQVEVG